jgi:16S rRNA processing protein RimM
MDDTIFRMELIAVGRISKPIGNQGELKILPLTDEKQRFENLQSVWVGHNAANVEQRDVCAVRIDAKQIVVSLIGVETLQEAETFRNKYLFVPKEQAVILRSGNYFIDDIIGCEVVTEENVNIGTVSDVLSLPKNDLWVVRKGEKEILIPAVQAIIRKVDIKIKCITIHALEGLLE